MNLLQKSQSLYREVLSTSSIVRRLNYERKVDFLKDKILQSTDIGISDEHIGKHDIIVSLTSYGKRIHSVAFVIESLMQQTLLANKIILWLDNSFKDTRLPVTLKKLQDRGLTLSYCEDIRSYKKLIPTLLNYPESIIITVDDDAIYNFDLIEKLVYSYLENPHSIYCQRMHKMTLDSKGLLNPYQQWVYECHESQVVSKLNFATGVGGILYPPGSLAEEIFNKDVFTKICPTADDVWFKAMSLLKGYPVTKVPGSTIANDYELMPDVQDMALSQWNYDQSQNDSQIRAVFKRYDLYHLLN